MALKNHKLFSSLFYQITFYQIVLVLLMTSSAFAGEQEVLQTLSVRDSYVQQTSLSDLEDLAGGKEQLIEILLKYRRLESPPFVAIRSERLLLNYTDSARVVDALEQDINDPKYFGLARTVGAMIDSVSNDNARTRLAQAVLNRAKSEKRFENYGRMLLESKDANVQKLAKETIK